MHLIPIVTFLKTSTANHEPIYYALTKALNMDSILLTRGVRIRLHQMKQLESKPYEDQALSAPWYMYSV